MNRKRTLILLLIVEIFFSVVLISCKHKPVEDDFDLIPQMEIVAGENYVYSDSTLMLNFAYKVKLKLKADDKFEKQLSRIEFSRINGFNRQVVLDSILSGNEAEIELGVKTINSKGLEEWKFKAFDEDNRSVERSLLIHTVNYPPVINFIKSPGLTYYSTPVNIKANFYMGITAGANVNASNNLSRFTVRKTYEETTELILDSLISSTEFIYYGSFKAGNVIRPERWDFIIEDNQGERDSVNFILDCKILTEMNALYSGTLFNAIGNNGNTFDLVNNVSLEIDAADDNVDMVNMSEPDMVSEPNFFESSWKSKNGTMFKASNDYPFETAYLETAVDAYTGATAVSPSSYTLPVSQNDIFIVKLRESQSYAVLKVLEVHKTEDDDLDRIEFQYKKVN